MKRLLLPLVLLFAASTSMFATYDTYTLTEDGDTLCFLLDTDDKVAKVTFVDNDNDGDPDYHYSGTVRIPEMVTFNEENYTVVEISSDMFYNNKELDSVFLPDAITYIPISLFYGCTNLKYVKMSDEVVTVESCAFYNCTSLEDVNFSQTITHVGGYALNGTKWLENEPLGPVYIGRCLYTFNGEMPENSDMIVRSGTVQICEEAFRNQKNLKTISLPPSLNIISTRSFAGSGLTSLIMPNKVGQMGEYIVDSCLNLHTIAFPSVIYSINELSLGYCPNLENITVPKDIRKLNYKVFLDTKWYKDQPDGVIYLANCLYKYKGTMPANSEIYVKPGVTQICGTAFEGQTNLVSITMPYTLEYISSKAFKGCTGLTNMKINAQDAPDLGKDVFDSVPHSAILEVAEAAYEEYSSSSQYSNFILMVNTISEVNVDGDTIYYVEVDTNKVGVTFRGVDTEEYNEYNGTVNVPATINAGKYNVVAILDYAFYGNSGLDSLVLPNSIVSIAHEAFGGTSIRNLTIPNSVKVIGIGAFSQCDSLVKVVFPNGLKKIDYATFSGCYALEDITFPQALEQLGTDCYLDETKWYNDQPDGFVYASNCLYQFKGEGEMPTNVILNDGTAHICGYLFQERSIETIVMPSSLKRISSYAFDSCTSLTKMTVNAITPPSVHGHDIFRNVDRTIPVFVPAEALSTYRETPVWCEFNLQAIPTSVENIEKSTTEFEFIQVGNSLQFEQATQVTIFSLNGACIYNGTTTSITISQSGIYVVKTPTSVAKIIVR